MKTITQLKLPLILIALSVVVYFSCNNKDLWLYSMTFMRQDQLSTANQLITDLAEVDLETGVAIELKATGLVPE